MKQWKFNAGDSIRITNYEGKTENIEYSNIQAMIGNVYVIDNIDEIGGYYRINSELFKENELELVDSTVDQPVVEKILIVNKVRPEYTTYIEKHQGCCNEVLRRYSFVRLLCHQKWRDDRVEFRQGCVRPV